ncbi:MAG: exopolysaccharide biosynthesis polyprenyl glycosylphosphotransferase [Verrucomicrobia bacterium]|nr:exopolysaccharide biosynthesis polyprenyl glycosylphosphotransferase [Verrucomicrobiota bacterium]
MKRQAKLSSGRAEERAGWGYPFRMVFADVVGLAVTVAGFHVFRIGQIPSYWPLEVFLVSLVFSLLALFVSGAYLEKSDKLSLEYATVHLSSFLLVFPLLMTSVYAFTAYSERMKPARAVVIPAIFSFALLSLVIRRASYQRMIRNKGKGYFAILGRPDDLRSLWHELLEKNNPAEFDFRFHDVVNRKKTNLAGVRSPEIGPWSLQALKQPDPNRVGIVMASHLRELPAGLHKKLAEIHLSGNRVYTAESFAEKVFGKVLLRDLDEEWVLDRELNLTQSASYGRLKETLDRAMAFFLLLLFLPVIVLAAGVILLLDGRPVFYLQKRRGLGEEVFEVIKFRTMKNRKEAGSDYTGERDERITLLGRILRPSRIDELPQLWNVLMGQMSLIGPRAEWVKLVERYEKEIPYYFLRHEVRPGLTGWAQVNFPYGSNLEDTREKLRYDLFYIRNHSFLLDFQIVLKTVYVVMAKVGGK